MVTRQLFIPTADDAFERHGIVVRIQDGSILYRVKDVVQFPHDNFTSSQISNVMNKIMVKGAKERYLNRRENARLFTELYDY